MGMKRIFAFLMIGALVTALTACESRAGRTVEEVEEPEATPAFVNSIKDDPRDKDYDDPDGQADEDETDEDFDHQGAEDAVRQLLNAMQSGNREEIRAHIDYTNLLQLEGGQDDVNFLSLMKKMRYEILEAQAEENRATVRVSITNVDMTNVFAGYVNSAMEMQYNNAIAESPRSEAEMEIAYTDLFVQMLDQSSAATVTQTVEIQLFLEAGRWVPQSSESLRQAVLGNFFTARQQLSFGPA